MKRSSALFFQTAIVLLGLGTLALMLWEPHLEGRNAHATTFEVYFHDSFLAYAYVGSIPYFVALYRAFGLFGHAGQTGALSQVTVEALRAIQRCALAIIAFVAGAIVFVILSGDKDDRPAGLFMCLLVIFGSSVVATVAAIFARNLRDTLARSEGSRV